MSLAEPRDVPSGVYLQDTKAGPLLGTSSTYRTSSPTVILNSLEDAHELLGKRSANTADRPRMVMTNEVYGWEWDFAHMRHDERWRYLTNLSPFGRDWVDISPERTAKPSINISSKRMHPLTSPLFERASGATYDSKHLKHTTHMCEVSSAQICQRVILKITRDHEVVSENDYYAALVDKAIKALLPVIHVGSSVVDVIPALKHIPAWFPGAKFKRGAQVYSQWTGDMRDVLFEQAKKEW
ncbi:hypothetical protein P691DRAFT_780441 [Macrolepiota fuliginosa MF-IS2]|uniref:Uncharacterized protein n=1 Tax=Macrolepiota fuliginosa MF-IS2 TaxID=1400762 RepID=A0A9P5XPD3_9AGAR|nr:hypothetical protein P691DRAFT_780441 [Macrolepiota fuliginosa MF-IS2]